MRRFSEKTIVVLGNFDGVHLGHRSLITRAAELRRELGYPAVVWTFRDLCGKDAITPPALRSGWLKHFGADEVVFESFEDFRKMSARDFVSSVLCETLNAAVCICGYNYRFGYMGEGNASVLSELCSESGIDCTVMPCVTYEGEEISSTVIRGLVKNGELERVKQLSGHHFAACGTVVEGKHLGRTIGMPTVNQIPESGTAVLPFGVYATYCRIDGNYYPSVTNIGVRPTFDDGEGVTCETHIIGYDGGLYGQDIPVGYISFLRGERRFASADELLSEVEKNKKSALALFERENGILLPRLD